MDVNVEKFLNDEDMLRRATRKQLQDVCSGINLEFPWKLNKEEIVDAIYAHLKENPLIEDGGSDAQEQERKQRKKGFTYTKKFPSVNLSPIGIWGGKRRKVLLPRPMREEDSREDAALFVGWNGAGIMIRYECEVDIPYPHFNTLKSTEMNYLTQALDSFKNGTKYYREVWSKRKTIPFQDMGVTPGTENLPESLREYYTTHFRNHAIEDFSDRELGKLARMLGIPMQRVRSDTELDILQLLNNPHKREEAA